MASEINIDVSAVTSKSALHEILAEKLGFPDYYGMNWDAFDECIRDYAPRASIKVIGINKLKSQLQRESQLLIECLTEFEAENPNERKVTIS